MPAANNFTSFPFHEPDQLLSFGRLHRRERRGDIFKAFAFGVDAEEPSHETPEDHHPGSQDIAPEERNAVGGCNAIDLRETNEAKATL
jgi:hypothetical protein